MFPLHFPYHASPCAVRFQLSFIISSFDNGLTSETSLIWNRTFPIITEHEVTVTFQKQDCFRNSGSVASCLVEKLVTYRVQHFNVTHFKSRITHLLYTAINTTEHGQVSQCLGFTKSLTSSIQRLGDVLHDNRGIGAISQVHLPWRNVECPA